MSASASPCSIQWQRVESRVAFSFWQMLRARILQDWRLDSSSSTKPVYGFVSQTSASCVVEVRGESLNDEPLHDEFVLRGDLTLCNTAHEFKTRDKQALLNETTADFCLLIYPNIKDNVFVYWFGFPADVLYIPGERGVGIVRDCVSWRVIDADARTDKADLVLPYSIYSLPEKRSYSFPWFARRPMARLAAESGQCEFIIRHANVGNSGAYVRVRFDPQTVAGRRTIIGWEPDARGAPCPRRVDLRAAFDTRHIADDAARLNLELMRWRALPELDLPLVENTRCLLLGAGTLGCHIARDLLAWGVRHITFVDAGRVAYSNPVRQPLFQYEDATKECWKAQAAAEALKRIHPTVVTEGHVLRIPMPAHPVHDTEQPQIARDIETLRSLIKNHDVVFLLTDTRESRWLPTLLARIEGRPALTVALGFDTWLVMRHGVSEPRVHRSGCYFCLDSLAPKNTTLNRTLDQQCTVTRPGVAPIASATAVELLLALLHHPARFAASSDSNQDLTAATDSPLGIVPHVVRGFVSQMRTMISSADCSNYCTACSDAICSAFLESGNDFLWRVFEDETMLERLVGVEELCVDFMNDEYEKEDEDEGI